MSRQDDDGRPQGMPPPGLVQALGLVAGEVGDADVAETTWRRGRGARRRRHAVVAGLTATVVGVAALAATSVLTQPDRELTLADGADGTGATVSAVPVPSPYSPQARAVQLREELRVACLRDMGWSVSVDGRDGSWSARGKRLADGTTADLGADLRTCDDLIGLGPRVQPSARGTRPDWDTDNQARQVYREYRSVAGCLREAHVAVPTVPDEDSFVYEYALAGGPTWHPYLSVRRLNALGEIMHTCPVNPTWPSPS